MPQTPGVPDHAAKEPTNVKNYLKLAAQVAVTVIAAIVALLNGTDHQPGVSDWINVIIIGLGAVGVVGAGNLPAGVWAHTKAYVAAATAAAVVLQSAVTDGVSAAEWLQIALAALGALGVVAAPGPKVVEASRFDALSRGLGDAGLGAGPR